MNESYRKKISHRKKNNELWTVFFHFLFGPPDCLDKWRKEEEDYAVEATTDAPAGVVSLRVCVSSTGPAGRSSIFTVEIKWMTGTIRKKQNNNNSL